MKAQLCDEVPVLIAGAGPIGLGLAAELGQRGIGCRVVEQGEGLIAHPRANIINGRTMEICRRWGIADRVRDASLPASFANVSGWINDAGSPGCQVPAMWSYASVYLLMNWMDL